MDCLLRHLLITSHKGYHYDNISIINILLYLYYICIIIFLLIQYWNLRLQWMRGKHEHHKKIGMITFVGYDKEKGHNILTW